LGDLLWHHRNLQFAATRWTGRAGPLDHDRRWQQARWLLVLLYAQRPAAISRLTLEDLDTSDGKARLCLGSVPVVLPRPLATLARDLAATRQPPPATLTACQDCPNSTSPASAAGASNASLSMPGTRSGWNAT